jgi:murein DD-endopeptidase MepM/ murein hydrolase activator NlpD
VSSVERGIHISHRHRSEEAGVRALHYGGAGSGRVAVIFVTTLLLLGLHGSMPSARAASSLAGAEHHLRQVNDRAHERQLAIRSFRRQLGRLAGRADDARRDAVPKPAIRARQADDNLHAELRARMRKRLRSIGRERAAILRRLNAAHRAVEKIARERERTVATIWRIRPIGFCPVRGPHDVAGDFGAPRWVDGRYHAHMGNDISAPYGTPIVAPFDGRAVSSPNGLGGLAVKVYGAAGYVYNAHLSRYGTLGSVDAGTVVGYVGTTGNAAGGAPHDHFEWHPGGGSAVDPYAELMQVC